MVVVKYLDKHAHVESKTSAVAMSRDSGTMERIQEFGLQDMLLVYMLSQGIAAK